MDAQRHLQLVSEADGKILVVDDDTGASVALCAWLQNRGLAATVVRSTSRAMELGRSGHALLAIIDFGFDSACSGIRLGNRLRQQFNVPFIVTGHSLDAAAIVTAMKAGACDVFEKPLDLAILTAAVDQALQIRKAESRLLLPTRKFPKDLSSNSDLATPIQRWARLVLAACETEDDPRTVSLWAHGVGASTSTLEETCRLCGVQTRKARDLARFLRAISRSRVSASPLCSEFAVGDERTLRKLFNQAGLSSYTLSVPIRTFLVRQQFVSQLSPCLRELIRTATSTGLA